jgi:vacuolar protein sorting-associated protein 35
LPSLSPDLHAPQTTANLLALLVAPINAYLSVLTLIAIPSYIPLLNAQPFTTRASIGQAVVSSVLKNDTVIDNAEDVSGVLGLCSVLVRDQKDSTPGAGAPSAYGRRGQQTQDSAEMAEEQGWLARMIHLFRSDDLAVQFSVSEPVVGFKDALW